MFMILRTLAGATVALTVAASAVGQTAPFPRLPSDRFDVAPPGARVEGSPGRMGVRSVACRTAPMTEIRRRIVDLTAQEWGFFGFGVTDETAPRDRTSTRGRRWWWRPMNPEDGARVASTIGGYWAATPQGSWMLNRQNARWNRPEGLMARWRDPWSAAFISWVMCEGGLGSSDRFQRAIAHHVYVDQAIRARDAESVSAAFRAFDIGETEVAPGDLLCSSRRGAYASIAQRRRHLGVSARMHCDIVVRLEPERERVLAIGGNVRGTVRLKILPAFNREGRLTPTGRAFAHLRLQADPIEDDALLDSPTLQALETAPGVRLPAALGIRSATTPPDGPRH